MTSYVKDLAKSIYSKARASVASIRITTIMSVVFFDLRWKLALIGLGFFYFMFGMMSVQIYGIPETKTAIVVHKDNSCIDTPTLIAIDGKEYMTCTTSYVKKHMQ